MSKSKLKESNPEAYKILRSKWGSMITRCTNPNNPNYKNYGGRGITVCEEWRKFANFFEWSLKNGYKPGLSIDRIDSNKDYCPDNCRYITLEEQQRNRRNNRQIIDPFDGQVLCLAAIAKKYNIPEETFRKRVDKYKIPTERALTKPFRETSQWNIVIDPLDGERLCLTKLARKYKMSLSSVKARIHNGWSLTDVVTIPVKKRVKRDNAAI